MTHERQQKAPQPKIQLIDSGRFLADGGAMFGAIPKTTWQRRYPCDDNNRCVMVMRSALVTVGDRIVLIDTGAGDKQLKRLSYYGFSGLADLAGELSRRGVSGEQVSDVVLTHLHFDHCGYVTLRDKATGTLLPAFPNATHWISRKQWDICHKPSPVEKDSYFTENISALDKANKVRLIDHDAELCHTISLRLYDGHTPGQIAPYIETPERTVVFAGDVIPLAASVSPEWISAYDTSPLTSYDEKIRMLEEAAASGQALIYCHDAYIHGSTIRKVNGLYKAGPVITF
ncbi:MAG: MBL fold metallo-hydrolase [Tannerellaceae bacterium]|jgi:glyoxylase-like metal-dependent hydrolase (beta-lactamase superfamily II)|nr:MBL fold metallo-hydrolase [Tannerellaceae bacterium]